MKATWNGAVITASSDTVVVEGTHYFPLDSVKQDYLTPSETHTVCPWKGTASYYDVVVNRRRNRNAVWYYPEPKEAAQAIRGRVAFWHAVQVMAD